MTVSDLLFVTGVLGEFWVWAAYFHTNASRQLLRKVSFISGSTAVVGIIGYITDLF